MKTVSLKFINEFKCIGPSCEDDCCHGWKITLNQPDFQRLKEAFDHSKADRHLFRDSINKCDSTQKNSPNAFAAIKLNAKGNCPFLESSGFCEVHRRFGPKALSSTCQNYPRIQSRIGDQVEISMTLSCPEAARLCLLQPLSTEPVWTEDSKQPSTSGLLDTTESNIIYHHHRTELREVLIHLLNRHSTPLEERLFSAAYFAEEIKPLHFSGMQVSCTDSIAQTVDFITKPESLAAIDNYFSKITPAPGFVLEFIQSTILAKSNANPRFKDLIKRCLGTTGVTITDLSKSLTKGDGFLHVDGDTNILKCYLDRRIRLDGIAANRINMYFENLIQSYLYQQSFINHPNISTYLSRVFSYIAIVRFLFCIHPKALSVIENHTATADAGEITLKSLDEAIVEVVYLFFRAVEHDHQFKGRIDSTLTDNQMSELENLASLIKF